jgi:phospholipase/carboxylesterase
MMIGQTSRELGSASRLGLGSVLGVALALGAACSSDDASPTSQATPAASPATSPAAAPGAEPGVPGATPGAEAPSTPPSGTSSPPSAAEGQAPTELSNPEAAAGAGEAGGTTPPEGEAGTVAGPDAGAAPGSDAVPSAGCGRARTLQDGLQTITSGGVPRTYFLETPDSYDGTRPLRVVFMFHWNYGSIEAIVNPPDADRNTDRPFYGMGDLTDDQTIFVVPQGLVNPGGGAGWANTENRDVAFTDDMLAAISADLCIDTSRVFTTGFSYGAGMSVALACVRPQTFRAAVVYAPAFISGVNPAQCTTPIAFFQSHGVDDPVLSYQTGLGVLDTFTGLNGCTALTPPEPPADGHSCVSLDGCSVPTRFCNFGAGEGNPFNTSLRGHYPTSKDPGQSTSWVPAEAWSFITQF